MNREKYAKSATAHMETPAKDIGKEMKKICLINNGLHIGISSVGEGYRKAFEQLGLPFCFLNLRTYPKYSLDQMNMNVQAHLQMHEYDIVIFIQPTYLYSQTMMALTRLKSKTQFVSIQTEDPYSLDAMLRLLPLFDIKYSNEKIVADELNRAGFRYLPVACDTFQQYREAGQKKFDLTMQTSFYGERLKYLKGLKELSCTKYIGGSLGYATLHDLPVDATGFTGPMGLIPRHKEYELYSESKFVLNPHREPKVTGVHYYYGAQKKCQSIVDHACSPNPRFFDAVLCGAIPLNDDNRTECMTIIKKHVPDNCLSFILPDAQNVGHLVNYIQVWPSYVPIIERLRKKFIKHESYLARAKQVLGELSIDFKNC